MINHEDYEKICTFLPITKNGRAIAPAPFQNKQEKFLNVVLSKGKYDINYVICLLKIIMDQCEKQKMNPKDFQFGLAQSLLKLIAMLEVERDQERMNLQ